MLEFFSIKPLPTDTLNIEIAEDYCYLTTKTTYQRIAPIEVGLLVAYGRPFPVSGQLSV
jgi:hypothetical protein